MLESITIFNKGGLILYQYRANPSVVGAGEGAANSAAFTEARLNAWMQKTLLGRKQEASSSSSSQAEALEAVQNASRTVAVLTEFVQEKDKIAVALYPDILFDGPRAYLKGWIRSLLTSTLEEYNIYEQAVQDNNKTEEGQQLLPARPDPKPFDKTFQALLDKSKKDKESLAAVMQAEQQPAEEGESSTSNKAVSNKAKKGKEKRHWGEGKVTKEAMAELDFSKPDSHTGSSDKNSMDPSDQAIAEARAAYLPNSGKDGADDDDDLDLEPDLEKDESSWGTSLQSVFDQMTGNKVLSANDLKVPLEEMQRLLTSKNVAQSVAKEICDGVQKELVGKRLNSFFRVKTAVRQGLESSISKILQRGRSGKDSNLDIIRAAMAKKSGGGFLLGGGNKKNQRPYVAVVLGINGVGKSTSLAKLAYYFQSHQMNPLLVAGDTFRSGAVEQLNVHAKCLDIPIFHQGYAKDPSAVAKAAIAHVMSSEDDKKRPDVILIDTAGRMQNNTPLMNALGKLVSENQPDLILLVAEALVGNDGVDQLKMFNRAMQTAKRQVDAVILTKFDTVSDKVGAALTMTHVTGAPILFVGTGQKYHHLKPLHANAVIQSLFR
jgi:signal recognition particle receptor subunit alpha